MKKFLLLFSMMALAFNASADNYVTIDDVRVRPGSSADVVVRYHFDSELICAYQFDVQFPQGISIDMESAVSGPTTPSTFIVGGNDLGNGHIRFATFSFGSGTGNEPITDHEGVLLTFTITADASLTGGVALDANAYELIFPENNGTQYNLPNVDFKVILDDDAVDYVLDEKSTDTPSTKNDANVKVIRSINANEWSTICLPFAMTEAQAKEAFGNDVKIAKISSVTPFELDDNPDYIYKIDVLFTSVTSIDANTPYIIKTSADVSEFIVTHVNVAATATPRTGGSAARMYGNYINGTPVPEFSLFLADNKFWYSNGSTKIKGLRGYFTFRDILTKVDEASAKVNIIFDGEATSIDNINVLNSDDKIYSVSGQYMGTDGNRLQRGVYIVNGKKVVKK